MDQPIPRQRQEAGGRGKGQTRPQGRHPYQMANRHPASNQRLPETLDGRHPPGGSQPEISFTEQTQGTSKQCAQKLRLGPQRGEGAPHPGRVRPSSSWLPELLRPGKAQNTGPTESAPLWSTREPELLSGVGLGSACNAGPAPWRAAWSLSRVDGEAHAP